MSEGIDLEAAWSDVEADWDDQARHAAFITQCRMAGQLGFAAVKYRGVSGKQEAYRSLADRSEDAKRRLGGITALALAELQTTAAMPDDNRRAMLWIKAAAVLAMLVGALMLFRACGT